MLGHLKRRSRFIYFVCVFMGQHQRLIPSKRPLAFFENYFSQSRLYGIIQSKTFLINNYQSELSIIRNKSKSKSKRLSHRKREEYESSDDDDDDDDDNDYDVDNDNDDDVKKLLAESGLSVGKNVEIVSKNLKSTRIDLVIKTLLKVNRKKVEKCFYENKIRVNGRVLVKKSQYAQIDDEIDLIYGFDDFSSNTLKIQRIKILKIKEDSDSDQDQVIIKALKFKSLLIDNYTDGDEWKEYQEN